MSGAYSVDTVPILTTWGIGSPRKTYPPIGFEVDYPSDGGCDIIRWDFDAPQPTPQDIEDQRKPYWAAKQRIAIDAEQELRSQTAVGFQMPQQGFELMEELYLEILLPAARRNITEADTPRWWGLNELRDNRNTLLALLESAIANANVTADQIRDFDVEGWSGWSIARP